VRHCIESAFFLVVQLAGDEVDTFVLWKLTGFRGVDEQAWRGAIRDTSIEYFAESVDDEFAALTMPTPRDEEGEVIFIQRGSLGREPLGRVDPQRYVLDVVVVTAK
jgi:hypothetical protein